MGHYDSSRDPSEVQADRFWRSLGKMIAKGPVVRIPDGHDRRRTDGWRR